MSGAWTVLRRRAEVVVPAEVWAMVTAAVVVAAILWLAVTPGGGTTNLPVSALQPPSLTAARPSKTGEVNPKLAAAVDALLARRGIAVRKNQLALFMRDVSPELESEQRRLFNNLRAIGVVPTFRRAEPWTNYDAQRRFGPATGSFRVTMRYQLLGTKLDQASTDVGYTFNVRSGRLYLVDDDDLNQELGAGRQPWDLGPVRAVRRPRALVIVDANEPGLGNRLADQTVSVAKQVRKLWPGPLPSVPVVVALSNPLVLTGSRPTLDGREPAAVYPMYSPALDGHTVGGWVVIRSSVRTTFDRARTAHVLAHLAPVRFGTAAPRWLAEGFAEYAANQQLVLTGRSAEVARRRLAVSRALSRLTALPTDNSFGDPDSSTISWLAVEYLVSEYGLAAVDQLYLESAFRGYNADLRERFLRNNTGLTEDKLVAALRRKAD